MPAPASTWRLKVLAFAAKMLSTAGAAADMGCAAKKPADIVKRRRYTMRFPAPFRLGQARATARGISRGRFSFPAPAMVSRPSRARFLYDAGFAAFRSHYTMRDD